jgi:allantoin racemase
LRILLGNPNTTAAITETMATVARGVAASGTEIKAATAPSGARVIGTRTEMVIGEYASLNLMAAESADCDAAIIGASIDSAVRAVREMLTIPVVGITEAALHTACLLGGKFGLVAMSARSAIVTREMVEAYGLTARMAGIVPVATTPAQFVADPDAAFASLADAANTLVERDMADVVVLVGAVMAGIPPRIQDRVSVPVIEGVTCAVLLAESLVRLKIAKPRGGSYGALPPRELSGVSDAVARRFGV